MSAVVRTYVDISLAAVPTIVFESEDDLKQPHALVYVGR